VDAELKAVNLRHLARIEGQVRGVQRMIEEDRYCADIITQIAAVRESLQSVAKNLLTNHLKHCARSAIKAGGREADEMYGELVDLVGKIAR
jgi:DNA-binding FrmR family transcriptional regulator